MNKTETCKERYIIEFLINGIWSPWVGGDGITYKFFTIESATRNLREVLDESRTDSYRFAFYQDKPARTRKIIISDIVYTDEIQDIIV